MITLRDLSEEGEEDGALRLRTGKLVRWRRTPRWLERPRLELTRS